MFYKEKRLIQLTVLELKPQDQAASSVNPLETPPGLYSNMVQKQAGEQLCKKGVQLGVS